MANFTSNLFNKKSLFAFYMIIIIISLSIAYYFYFSNERENVIESKQKELEAISILKINELKQWLQERRADAIVLSRSKLASEAINKLIQNPEDQKLKAILHDRFSYPQKEKGYSSIILCKNDFSIVLSVGEDIKSLDNSTIEKLIISKDLKTVNFSDLYKCPTHKAIHFDLFAPVLSSNDSTIAYLILRIDPEKYLFPLLSNWPNNSKSSETVIVRKEYDSLVTLNYLKKISNSALNYKLPLSMSQLPAARAINGERGIIEGIDYRGTKVLAYLSQIPHTNWFMVNKIDKSELFADYYYEQFILIILAVLFVLLLSSILGFLFQKSKNQQLENIFIIQEEYRTTLFSIGDAVISTDKESKIKYMNTIAENLTGWKFEEAKGIELEKVFVIVNEDTREKVKNPVELVIEKGGIVGLANHTILISKDAREIPIADSGAPIKDENGNLSGIVLVFRDQTEERDTQKKIEMEMAKAQKYLDIAGAIIIALDKKCNVSMINHKGCDIIGFNHDEIIGKNWFNTCVPEKCRDILLDNFFTSIGSKDKLIEKNECSILTKDNKERYIIWTNSLIFDENNEISGMLCSGEDITERKRAEDALVESEKKFRLMYENAPLSYQSLDTNACLIDVNPTWLKTLGYERDEVIGKHFTEFLTPESAELVKTRFPYFVSAGEVHDYVFEMVRKDGSCIWVSYEGKIGKDEFGNFKQTHCIFNDITEKRKAEKDLIDSENKFKSYISNAPNIITVIDKNGVIKYLNKAEFGMSVDYFLGKRIFEMINPDLCEEIKTKIENTFKTKIPCFYINNAVLNGETYWYSNNCGIIDPDNPESDLIIISTNITDRKIASDALRESEMRFSKAFHYHPAPMSITNIDDGKVLNVNSSYCKIVGYEADELIGKYVKDLKLYSNLNDRQSMIGKLKQDGRLVNYELDLVNKSGAIINSLVSIEIIEIDGQECALATFFDITESKVARKALVDSEKSYRDLFNNVLEAIYIQDEKFRFIDVNDWAVQLYGYSKEDFIGKTPEFLSAPDKNDLNLISELNHKAYN